MPRKSSRALAIAALAPLAAASGASGQAPRAAGLGLVDLAGETFRQVVVDREPGQYLGHPTTALLEDGKTILCVYPKGHGKGAILFKRSEDGGKTWSARLPTPASWETSLETPTISRTVDRSGKKRLLLFSGLYPIRLSVSEDDGKSWTKLSAFELERRRPKNSTLVIDKGSEEQSDGWLLIRLGQTKPVLLDDKGQLNEPLVKEMIEAWAICWDPEYLR